MSIFKFLTLQTFIIVPFISGYQFKEKYPELFIEKNLSERLLKINLMFLEPWIIFWFITKLKINISTFFLSISGFFLVFTGFFIGSLIAYHHSTRNKLTIIINTSLANHGYTMGGIVCYFFLGEMGLSKALIFISYFYFYIYGFLFPWVQWKKNQKISYSIKVIKNKILNYRFFPLYALILSCIFMIWNISIPKYFFIEKFINYCLYTSIIIYYFTLGTNLNIKNVFIYKYYIIKILFIKFIIIPAITFIIVMWIPEKYLENFDKIIILIMSFMPGAIYSVVTSILFRLNTQLSIQIFLWSNFIFIVIVLPVLYFSFHKYLFSFFSF